MRILPILSILLVLITGCAPSEEKATLHKGTPIKQKEVVAVSSGTYQTGDIITEMLVTFNDESTENLYVFGGFIDENTFTINVRQAAHGYNGLSFHYTVNKDMTFTLPLSSTTVKLTEIDVKGNRIQLELLN